MSLLGEWIKLSTNNKNLFTKRWGHTSTNYSDKIYFFGGYNDTTTLTFQKLETTGDFPPIRSNHTAVLYENSIIIHGGSDDNNNQYGDTYFFNVETNHWSKLEIHSEDQISSKRTYHTADIIEDKMIIFGGENEDLILNDLSILNLKTLKFHKINQNLITPRAFHSSAVIDKKLFLYGGYKITEKSELLSLNEMIILDFSNFILEDENSLKIQILNFDKIFSPFPRWGSSLEFSNNSLILFGGRNKRDFNDIWSFKITNFTWKKIITNSDAETPQERRRHSHCLINNKNILFISGGFNGSYLNDIFILNLNSMQKYNESSETFSKFINNPILSDFSIFNSNSQSHFYLHKNLFFKRISVDEIRNSKKLLKVFSNKKYKIKIKNENNFTNEIILNLIEILYTGKLPKIYLNVEEFKQLFKLMKFFRLENVIKKITKSIFDNIIYEAGINIDGVKFLQNLCQKSYFNIFEYFLEQNIITPNVKLFYNLDEDVILIKNNSMDVLQFINKISMDVLSSFHTIHNLYEKKIFNKFLFILKSEKFSYDDNLVNLIELLFYSDFLSIEFLLNKFELILFDFICRSNVFVLIVIAYKSNSEILFIKIVEFIFIQNISISKLEDEINYLTDDGMKIIQEIKKIKLENELFYKIVKENDKNKMTIYSDDYPIIIEELPDKIIQIIFNKLVNKNFKENKTKERSEIREDCCNSITPHNR